MSHHHHFVLFVVIYSISLAEMVYFLISALFYLYKNPQYRVFWAAFYLKPTEEDIHAPYAAVALRSPGVESKSHAPSIADTDQENNFQPKPQHIVSKQTAFIHYGLETISHCFLMPAYLICYIIFMITRMNKEFIAHAATWSEEEAFCSFVFKSYVLVSVSHHIALIMLCIPALKAEFLYQSTKWHRNFIIFTIFYIILDCIMLIIRGVTVTHDVVEFGEEADAVHVCIPIKGVGMDINWTYFVVAQFYFTLILTFLCVIIPICYQRKRLMDFQNAPSDTGDNEENKELLELLKKINKMSKRVCIAAAVIFVLWLTVNMLFWEYAAHPTVQPYLSISNTIIYVHLYLVVICVYQNWKQRLCPWGCGVCGAQTNSTENDEEVSEDEEGVNEEERAHVTNTELV